MFPPAAVRAAIYAVMDRLRFLRPLVPKALRRAAFSAVADRVIEELPSRAYLQAAILPALVAAGRRNLLFVGTQAYNLGFYRDCEARGITVTSIDLDPASARWGAPGGHFTGDIREADRIIAGGRFDAVLFNGILGYGIDTAEDAARAIDALVAVAEPGALLVVGWNPGRTDGREIEVFRGRLEAVSLGPLGTEREFPPQRPIESSPQRYEFFRLRPGE